MDQNLMDEDGDSKELDVLLQEDAEVPQELRDLLPDEIRDELQRRKDEREQKIAALTQSLIRKRTEAVDYRSSTGIESEWDKCEDSYEGIDDANRSTEQSPRLRKPTESGQSPIRSDRKATRSTVFLNITRPYVDAAAARVADMLLPTDDRNFDYRATPIQDYDIEQVSPEALAQMGFESAEQFIEALEEDANKRAKRAEKRVDDWLVESQYHGEVRKVIEDSARLGTGILKGPVPIQRKKIKPSKAEDGALTIEVKYEISPDSRRIDPWDAFPDPSCGEEVRNGSHFFERDRMSAKQLRDLTKPGGHYIESELQAVLDEGPSKINKTNDGRRTLEDDRFEVWKYYGQISVDDLVAVTNEQMEKSKVFVSVVVEMINDRIVKVAESHLDSGDIPFDFIPWQRRVGLPFGIGVARQIDVPQRMLNSATRGMNDNAGLSNGPQVVMKKGIVEPADGVFELTGRKLWFVDPEKTSQEVDQAFRTYDIPTRQAEIMNIIQFALKIAEDVTGLPQLMQGNQGQAPDTVGGMQILNSNANTVLRRIARAFDDCITEPHMRRYYEWIMLYGEDSEKGDYTIDARGSTSLVERDIQQRTILGLQPMVSDPRFGLDPELWAHEALRINKIDPKRLALTEQKKAEMQQQQAAQMQAQAQEVEAQRQHEKEIKGAEINRDLTISNNKNRIDAQKFVAEANLKRASGAGI